MLAQIYEISLEDGEWSREFAISGNRQGALLVTVQSLDGPADFEAQVELGPVAAAAGHEGGAAAAAPGMARAHEVEVAAQARAEARAFADLLPRAASTMLVRITGSVGRRFRVFVGWARDRLPGNTCDRCKLIVRAALFALRATVGAVGPDDLPVELIDFFPDWGVLEFLKRTLGVGAWDALEKVLQVTRGASRLPAKIAEEVCRRLGFCP